MDFGYKLNRASVTLSLILLLLAFVSCNNGGSTGSGSTGLPPPRPPGWGTPQLIGSYNADSASSPQIALDDLGNAVAVWYQSDDGGSSYHIWANYFNGSSWGAARLIENSERPAYSPRIAMNSAGNAIAVWYQNLVYNSPSSIWANHFNGSNWGTAQMIESIDDSSAFSPQIAMDNSGNAIAVWEQWEFADDNIYANHYNGSTWGTARLLESLNGGHGATDPQIAMDSAGNAIAVWGQNGPLASDDIWAAYFNGSDWSVPQLIESSTTESAWYPQIAMNSVGVAVAVWIQSDGSIRNIWANYFDGSTWGTAQLIESDDTGDAESPQITMDGAGNAITVWSQSDGSRDNIWTNHFDGSGWGTPRLLESDDTSNATYPQIAMNRIGQAFAVWHQGSQIRANRFDGSAWGSSLWIGGSSPSSSAFPQIAINSAGNAIAVWKNGSNISANRYE